MKVTTIAIKNKFKLFIILFCYIFAFYISGISVSILLGIILWIYASFNKELWNICLKVFSLFYIKKVLTTWFIVTFFSTCIPIIFQTFDFSFCRIIFAQLIHIIAAIPVFGWLKYKRITNNEIQHYFIYIFVVQTFIQLTVLSVPSLGNLILKFNNYDPESVVGLGQGIRGKALSAATTYHLTMAYGIAFIVYIKVYFKNNINLVHIVIGICLFVGIFFAGRSGFIGCFIGAIGFIIYPQINTKHKCYIAFKSLFYITISVASIYCLLKHIAPEFINLLNEQILPYAFEFLYSLDSSGEMETASTNRLKEMWETKFKISEFLIGSGKYSNPDGSYYMHVDPGIIRHLLYMGIFGYVLLVIYQFTLLPVHRIQDKSTKHYYSLILLFLFAMEFKCVNIAVNKFAFAISLLLSYSYFYLNDSNETNPISNSLPPIK